MALKYVDSVLLKAVPVPMKNRAMASSSCSARRGWQSTEGVHTAARKPLSPPTHLTHTRGYTCTGTHTLVFLAGRSKSMIVH